MNFLSNSFFIHWNVNYAMSFKKNQFKNFIFAFNPF